MIKIAGVKKPRQRRISEHRNSEDRFDGYLIAATSQSVRIRCLFGVLLLALALMPFFLNPAKSLAEVAQPDRLDEVSSEGLDSMQRAFFSLAFGH